MYIASKSKKKSSCATRFFGADVVFFRQTGRKPANSGKNGGNPAKKQFANQINFHLYHYAGNNPVKYLDPTGNYSVDDETKTITADLNDKKDMTAASRAFFTLQNDGFKCKAENSSTGNSMTFNNAKGMYAFLDGKYDQYLENGDFNFDSLFLDIYSLAIADASKDSLSSVIGKSISYITIISDMKALAENYSNGNIIGTFNTTSDLIIDVVGVYGFEGTCLSIGLKYTKQGFMFGTNQMAKAQCELEKFAVNKWINELFGVSFK